MRLRLGKDPWKEWERRVIFILRTYVFPTFEGAIFEGAGLCKTFEAGCRLGFLISDQKVNVRAAD